MVAKLSKIRSTLAVLIYLIYTLKLLSMAKPTTPEERKFIEDKVKEKWTSRKIADVLGISIKTVNKWRQRLKKRWLYCL